MQVSAVEVAAAKRSRRYGRALALLGMALAAIACYAPALHAYFAEDDYTLLALSRLLHAPLLAFNHDHFPGSLFFRPLGIVVWWLTTALFDNAPRGHYAVNLALHLGCVFALYALLQRLRRNAPTNVLWATAFAVHPISIGTALWLSDRFDLIATIFSLLAVRAAIGYVQRPRWLGIVPVLSCLLLAFMGKEIAIVAACASCALIALPNRDWPLTRIQRWPAVSSILLLTAAWLVYRAMIMTNPQNSLLHLDSIVSMFTRGFLLWLRLGYDYFVADPRQAEWMFWLQGAGAVCIATAILLSSRDGFRVSSDWGLAAAVLTLILLPGPTQAPVISIFVHATGAARGWFNMVIESRLYQLTLCAVIVALVLLTTRPGTARAGRWFSRVDEAAAIGLTLMIAAWIPASYGVAHDYAKHTRAQRPALLAAHEVIGKLELPIERCQLYFLNTAGIKGFDGSSDAMIKATTPTLARLDHCLIMTERTPWGNFVRTGSVADYRPLRELTHDGTPVPWLHLGNVELAYFNLDSNVDARSIEEAFFLEYGDGGFRDVTSAVHSGARPVRFFNARPDQY